MTIRQPASPLWFGAPLLAMYAAAFGVAEALPRLSAPGLVAAGLTADLVFLVPALFYAVMVRGRGWPAITLAPVFLLGYGAASLLVPAQHHALLIAVGYALPAVELPLSGFVAYKAWRIVRANREANASGGDFYDRMREVLSGAFSVPAVAGAFAYEIAVLHYAFAVRPPEPPPDGFAYHRRSGYGAVLVAVLMAAALELGGVHVLLRMWSEKAALFHVALTLYGVVWLVGDYRAMRRRPHELRATGLRVRCGLRWNLDVAWNSVSVVRRTRQPPSGDDYLNTVPIGGPQYVVELRMPVEATGLYGVVRSVRHVGLAVDEPAAFEVRLRSLGVRVEP